MKKYRNQIQTDYLTITVTDKKKDSIGYLLHRELMSSTMKREVGISGFDRRYSGFIRKEEQFDSIVYVICNLIN